MEPKVSLPHSQVAEYCVTRHRIVKWYTICPTTILHDPITQNQFSPAWGQKWCYVGRSQCITRRTGAQFFSIKIPLAWQEIQCREEKPEL